jgi:hypothetical protein
MQQKPDYIFNNDEMVRHCESLDARLKAIDPTFDSNMRINVLINMGEMKFGYDDVDVKYLRKTVLKKEKADGLTMYTIYDHPKDFPDHFVVRKWKVIAPNISPISDGVLGISETLDGARKMLPMECTCLSRDDSDESQIVESWI